MIKTLKVVMAALVIALTTACSFDAVPPAHKGKILSPNGYKPDLIETGKVTTWWRDSLVLLETGTGRYAERVSIKMADKLTLTADIKFRGRVQGSEAVINAMFNDIKFEGKTLPFSTVYAVYGRDAVREAARAVLSKYDVHEVHSNYERISLEVGQAVQERLQNTPLEISQIMLGNIEYPKVVTTAIDEAAARDMAIAKEEAQAAIDMTKKQAELKLAKANYEVEMTKARAVRDANKVLGQGITAQLLQLKALEVQEKMAANGNTVFMPFEAMGTIGAQQRIYGGK